MAWSMYIDNKRYRQVSQHSRKSIARAKAAILRKKGKSARVIYWEGKWTVFKRIGD